MSNEFGMVCCDGLVAADTMRTKALLLGSHPLPPPGGVETSSSNEACIAWPVQPSTPPALPGPPCLAQPPSPRARPRRCTPRRCPPGPTGHRPVRCPGPHGRQTMQTVLCGAWHRPCGVMRDVGVTHWHTLTLCREVWANGKSEGNRPQFQAFDCKNRGNVCSNVSNAHPPTCPLATRKHTRTGRHTHAHARASPQPPGTGQWAASGPAC